MDCWADVWSLAHTRYSPRDRTASRAKHRSGCSVSISSAHIAENSNTRKCRKTKRGLDVTGKGTTCAPGADQPSFGSMFISTMKLQAADAFDILGNFVVGRHRHARFVVLLVPVFLNHCSKRHWVYLARLHLQDFDRFDYIV